jgi:hypothetical protein
MKKSLFALVLSFFFSSAISQDRDLLESSIPERFPFPHCENREGKDWKVVFIMKFKILFFKILSFLKTL